MTGAHTTIPALWEEKGLPRETWFKEPCSQGSWPIKVVPHPPLGKWEGDPGLGHRRLRAAMKWKPGAGVERPLGR